MILVLSVLCTVSGAATSPLPVRSPSPAHAPSSAPSLSRPPSAASRLPNPDFKLLGKLDLSKLPTDEHGTRIVARVNGRPIPEAEFTVALNRAVSRQGKISPDQADALKAAIAAPVLDDLIRSALIREYAEKHGLDANEEEVSQVLKRVNGNLPPGKKMQDEAMQRGEAPELIRQEIRERLIQNRVVEEMGKDILPASPEQEAEWLRAAEAAAQGGSATSSTEIRARHIVFRCPADAPTSVSKEMRTRAEKVLALIRGGMDFTLAVHRYSQDRSTRDLDGDLGFFARGRMYPEFDQAAFALRKGEVSEVVQTPVGFHIIQVTDRREAGIQSRYQASQREKRFSEWLEKAYREAKVERYI